MTTCTVTTSEYYERYLLPRYQRGQLHLMEVADLLNVSIYYVAYYRQAIGSPTQKKP